METTDTIDMLTNAEENAFYCSKCHKSYKTSKALTKHFTTNSHLRPTVMCKICLKGFRDNSNLIRHMRVHRKKPILEKVAPTPKKTITCEVCHVETVNNRSLLVHIRLNHQCKLCTRKLRNIKVLGRHYKLTHKVNIDPHYEFCRICFKQFQTATACRTHFKYNHEGRVGVDTTIKCPFCVIKISKSQGKRFLFLLTC